MLIAIQLNYGFASKKYHKKLNDIFFTTLNLVSGILIRAKFASSREAERSKKRKKHEFHFTVLEFMSRNL